MSGTGLTIGVDIGGTKVLAGVVDPGGTIIEQARRDTPADDVEVVNSLSVARVTCSPAGRSTLNSR